MFQFFFSENKFKCECLQSQNSWNVTKHMPDNFSKKRHGGKPTQNSSCTEGNPMRSCLLTIVNHYSISIQIRNFPCQIESGPSRSIS